MSDLGRKGLGEQAQEKITPDSQKSTLEQAKEGVTSLGDRAAGAIQPGLSPWSPAFTSLFEASPR